MWRIKYYQGKDLVDISFNIKSKEEAKAYAPKHAKELEDSLPLGGEVTYKISKDK